MQATGEATREQVQTQRIRTNIAGWAGAAVCADAQGQHDAAAALIQEEIRRRDHRGIQGEDRKEVASVPFLLVEHKRLSCRWQPLIQRREHGTLARVCGVKLPDMVPLARLGVRIIGRHRG